MAFTVHYDLLCSVWRSSLYIFDGVFKIPYFSELNITAFMWATKSWLTGIPNALILNTQHGFSIMPDSANYLSFLGTEQLYRYLFIFKLLFLLVDVALLIVIIKYIRKNLFSVVLFWAINPFILFSTYMWGRYEIFPVLFMLISFLIINKSSSPNKDIWSFLWLGLAFAYRISFILFLPLLLIYFYKNYKRTIAQVVVGILPYLLTSYAVIQMGGGRAIDEYVEIMFSGQLGIGFTSISLFIVSYLLILYATVKSKSNQTLTYKKLIYFSGLAILSYFAFAQFYPQYFAWITPIAILFIGMNKKTLPLFLLLFVVFFFLSDAYFGCNSSVCILTNAISPSFAATYQSFTTQILEKVSNQTIFVILHSIMIGIMAIIALMVKPFCYEDKK